MNKKKDKIVDVVIGIGVLSFILYTILMNIWLFGIIKLMYQ